MVKAPTIAELDARANALVRTSLSLVRVPTYGDVDEAELQKSYPGVVNLPQANPSSSF
jgi:hypothetical protein